MVPLRREDDWRRWEATADRPEIQDLIRRAIRAGTIRVAPARGGGIRILSGMPARGSAAGPGPEVTLTPLSR